MGKRDVAGYGKLNLSKWDSSAQDMLRQDLAAIIRSVEPDWMTRGYGDADLRNKIREWADFMKWAGDDHV